MPAYYSENDPFAAAWLRKLIEAGLIANGDVDDRSIRDVHPDDLRGYSQCHFFAGIGGWSLAFRLAGLDDDFPAWTGSCPCQPFSQAGKRKGTADDRHLWPAWFRLVRERRPSIVFGEQVANAIGHGWLDAVADDMEGEGYAVGAAVLPACAVGAPHRRDRLWFVADAGGAKLWQQSRRGGRSHGQGAAFAREHGAAQSLAHANGGDGYGRGGALQVGRFGSAGEAQDDGDARRIEWPVEPAVDRVAHGVPNRVGALRGFGNAIVPQVAAEFIAAAIEVAP